MNDNKAKTTQQLHMYNDINDLLTLTSVNKNLISLSHYGDEYYMLFQVLSSWLKLFKSVVNNAKTWIFMVSDLWPTFVTI